MQSQKLDLRFGDELHEAVLGCVDTDCSVGEQRKMSAENLKSKWRRSEHENFSVPHRRSRVFSFFDCRSSFSRFSDFIEASRGKIINCSVQLC